jgi:2-desacetyl-2-hydroxyethyl bacteriochlorophyllide A dehydrogenase
MRSMSHDPHIVRETYRDMTVATQSSTVRRATITAPRQLELRMATPREPGPHDLVIHPDAIGICGTDLELLDGTMPYLASGFATYPLVPGHEWTGIVTDVGQAVTEFALGDRVVGECSVGCGGCTPCLQGAYHLCQARTETGIAGRDGALSTQLIFPTRAAHHVPGNVSAADAALIEPLAVAYRGVRRTGAEPSEPLAVIGAGTIGLLCALVARALGTEDVELIDRHAARRDFAASLGFPVAEPRAGHPVRRVIDASGTGPGVATALETCDEGGTVVLLGLTGTPTCPIDVDSIVVRDLTVRGSLGSPNVWPEVIQIVARGQVQPSKLVSHQFTLDDVAEAFELAAQRDPSIRKVIVRPTPRDQS